jgi:hypothetical protein
MINLMMLAFRRDDALAMELIRRTDIIADPRVARAVLYRSGTDVYAIRRTGRCSSSAEGWRVGSK